MPYEVYTSGSEANGRTIRSVVEGIGEISEAFRERALRILEENGIPEPEPGEWYSMQAYLDAFEQLDTSIGPNTVQRIGRQIPNVVEWPPHIETVPEALQQLDDVYQMNHRGGEIGYYEFEQTDRMEGEMECRNPYPSALDEGLITGTAREFADEAAFVRVEELDTDSNDEDLRIYSVEW